ncbi:cytochrome B6, putative [Babesia ovata]|uniref:Cytochrome B6, putative n=1 Tax=Babesia ovata TaxID=189622 RepID=A0A2H6K8J6_9APIC|nr:cytochrome B6, putative [Babesia ovata]GBE59298.1 cytochrome B6, putative [Babesia ovata]
MSVESEREALIRQHNRLKDEVESINNEIRKLERANEYLRQQNANMRRMVEQSQSMAAAAAPDSSVHTANGRYDDGDVSKTPEARGGPFYQVVTDLASNGESMFGSYLKHVAGMANDFASKLQLTEDDYKFQSTRETVLQHMYRRNDPAYMMVPSLSSRESGIDTSSEMGSPVAGESHHVERTGYYQEVGAGYGADGRADFPPSLVK